MSKSDWSNLSSVCGSDSLEDTPRQTAEDFSNKEYLNIGRKERDENKTGLLTERE